MKRFHADTGIFAENAFRDEIKQSNQKITYCAVGAHHQNGLVERHIGTSTKGARINLLYAQRKCHAVKRLVCHALRFLFSREFSFDKNS